MTWASRKQKVVARLSTEVEYRDLAHTAAELSWVQSILGKIGILANIPPVIWCDNTSTISLAANLILHNRSKHVVDLHFVKDKVMTKTVDLRYVPTDEHLEDGLTNELSEGKFEVMRNKLNVVQPYSRFV